MPTDDPRYAVYEIEYDTDDGRKESKVCFINYNPDAAKTTVKFNYANAKKFIRGKCDPVSREIQINYHSDLTFKELRGG